jgi:hypothetical protein
MGFCLLGAAHWIGGRGGPAIKYLGAGYSASLDAVHERDGVRLEATEGGMV